MHGDGIKRTISSIDQGRWLRHWLSRSHMRSCICCSTSYWVESVVGICGNLIANFYCLFHKTIVGAQQQQQRMRGYEVEHSALIAHT